MNSKYDEMFNNIRRDFPQLSLHYDPGVYIFIDHPNESEYIFEIYLGDDVAEGFYCESCHYHGENKCSDDLVIETYDELQKEIENFIDSTVHDTDEEDVEEI